MRKILITVLLTFSIFSSYGQRREGLKAGFTGIMETSYLFKQGPYGIDRFKLNLINGYQFNPYVYLGVGVGYRYYFNSSIPIIPIFGDLRVYVLNNKYSPFISFAAGYSYYLLNDFKEVGPMINPKIGLCIKQYEKTLIQFGFEFEAQLASFYDRYFHITFEEPSGAIGVFIGITY